MFGLVRRWNFVVSRFLGGSRCQVCRWQVLVSQARMSSSEWDERVWSCVYIKEGGRSCSTFPRAGASEPSVRRDEATSQLQLGPNSSCTNHSFLYIFDTFLLET